VWDPQIKRDRIKLDSILSKEKIDTVEIRSWGRNGTETIKLIDGEAFQFVASLHQTNRINNIDWTKQQQEEVVLFKGIDEVCRLHKGEDGAWEFEKYGFRLRK
jgi:hypothetical protein